ncbi:uncharacterized protein N7459_001859 [Penicillium hispanicum]|uniref:uncharacterized protein n=1 Tax=Penicillium hispanicum TaxID=1080232 RepID=UPI00253FCEC5|nr:uncharacterized protein N7459_001859 [Penicillium hispanicum]KAJ5591490.1 hypothetical protein N7459_001859 [Penicillium hispanicum]
MSTMTQVAPAGQIVASEASHQNLQLLFKQIHFFASIPESRAALAMINETIHLQEQLVAKENALKEEQEKLKTAAHNNILGAQIEEKDKAIEGSKKKLEELEREKADIRTELTQERNKHQKSLNGISAVVKKLKDRDGTIAEMKTAESTFKSTLASAEKDIRALQAEKAALNKALQAKQTRLQLLESFTVEHSDINDDAVINGFTNLCQLATREISSCFQQDLDAKVLEDKSIWDKFRKDHLNLLQQNFPFKASNTSAAKDMRLAITLAILSREINKHIFQPNYILPDDSDIRETLIDLAGEDPEKERFLRSMLLSIDPKAQDETVESKANSVVHNVSGQLSKLISQTQHGAVHASISKIVGEAKGFWRLVQRAQHKYEIDFEDSYSDERHEWKPFAFPSDGDFRGTAIAPVGQDGSFFTVFPCLYSINDGEEECLVEVAQLRKHQRQCVEAAKEMDKAPLSPTSNGTSSSPRRRKTSVACPNGSSKGNGFL